MKRLASVVLAALASSAGAQQPADPIGDILNAPPTAVAPAPPQPAQSPPAPPPAEATRPPDNQPTEAERNFEARMRSSFAAAQGRQGPLDGRWTLATAGGGDLYDLALVDTGGQPLEGAWRDLRRMGAVDGSGFLSEIQRLGGQLTFRFYPQPGDPAVEATLNATADGRWTGELVDHGQRQAVVLRRD